jgi:hypothetical protein
MAITKTANNITIKVKNNYVATSKTIDENSGKIEIVATKENLTLISNKKINIKGNKS